MTHVESAAADEQMAEFLSGVVGVVEATSFEKHMLWAENGRKPVPRTWQENLSGLGETVGTVGSLPVCVSLSTALVDGRKLLFVDAVSRVVDHEMVDDWLRATLPRCAFREDGYLNRVDATNFHNVFVRSLPKAA